MDNVNYEQQLLDDMEKQRQKLLEVGDKITGLFTMVPLDGAERLEYYLSLVTTTVRRGWDDEGLYGLWSKMDGARRNINTRKEQLEAYKDAISRCRLPELGEFYSLSMDGSRYRSRKQRHVYEVTRGIGHNLDSTYGNQGEMCRLTPSGKLSDHTWRFGLSTWANYIGEKFIREPQYMFEGEYELKDLDRVSKMLPFILGTAYTQQEKRDRICQQNLRKVIKKLIAEPVLEVA